MSTMRLPERLVDRAEAEACVQMMATTEPWITLGLRRPAMIEILLDPAREAWLVRDEGGIGGFVLIDMRGTFAGYIQTVCVRSDLRSKGLGAQLLRWVEERIFRDTPNVFLCVSSFNEGARRFYELLGYETVGTLRDFVLSGYDELLLRKTRGSLREYRAPDAGDNTQPRRS